MLKKLFLMTLLLSVVSCSEFSKIDGWRAEANRMKLNSYRSTLDENKDFNYWYESLEPYCKSEGWTKERCEESIKKYMKEYTELRDKEQNEREAESKKKEDDLKSKGY